MSLATMTHSGWPGVIEKYRQYMPLKPETQAVTLLEGNTPLIPLPQMSERLKGLHIYAKYEGVNPTGSFKDRGMTMAMTNAVEEGHQAVICASTGNTSASAAAYASRAGLTCTVILPKGAIALGKLSQAFMHGAKVIAIEGNFDDALRIVLEICENHPVQLVNSLNPYRIEGQKSGSFEICDVLGAPPDFQAMPVGNAGISRPIGRGIVNTQRPELPTVSRLCLVSKQQVRLPSCMAILLRSPKPLPRLFVLEIPPVGRRRKPRAMNPAVLLKP